MVDFDAFLNWAKSRFDSVIVKGKEIKLNSIFAEDKKHHLWCNTKGGIHHRNDGCYRCFYTDKKGTLVGLVMLVDNCSYKEAKSILSGETPIAELEARLDDFFSNKEKELKIEYKGPSVVLPKEAKPVSALDEPIKTKVEQYLTSRKIPSSGFYFCETGKYKNRIVIPYYDKSGTLVYFNCRSLSNKGLRYIGPEKEIGVGKGDVIFAKHWPKADEKVYLTEGEFDAISLSICGFNGMACGGKYLSDTQIEILKMYKVCLALDEDSSGFKAIIEMGKKLILNGIEVTFVRPPKGIKDWNNMLISYKAEIIQAWISKYEKKFDEWSEDLLNIISL